MKGDARNVVVPIVALVGAGLGVGAWAWGDALLADRFGSEHWAAGLLSDPISMASFGCFGVAIAMLVERAVFVLRQRRAPAIPALDGGDDVLLTPDDVKAARQQFATLPAERRASLQGRLLDAGLQRARAHWSAEDVSNAVKTEAELVQTRTYADYSMIRFLVWAIPTLGFIGTVVGISLSMGLLAGAPMADAEVDEPAAPAVRTIEPAPRQDDPAEARPADGEPDTDESADGDADDDKPADDASGPDEPADDSAGEPSPTNTSARATPAVSKPAADAPTDDMDPDEPPERDADLAQAQRALAMAFNTTFVALVLSLVAMFLLHRVESWEDGLLVDATRAVLRRLPLRMYVRQENVR